MCVRCILLHGTVKAGFLRCGDDNPVIQTDTIPISIWHAIDIAQSLFREFMIILVSPTLICRVVAILQIIGFPLQVKLLVGIVNMTHIQ